MAVALSLADYAQLKVRPYILGREDFQKSPKVAEKPLIEITQKQMLHIFCVQVALARKRPD